MESASQLALAQPKGLSTIFRYCCCTALQAVTLRCIAQLKTHQVVEVEYMSAMGQDIRV